MEQRKAEGTKLYTEVTEMAGRFTTPNPGKSKKGRNQELLKIRNERLFHRYYFYAKIIQLNYADLLRALCLDFCLTENTLPQLLQANADNLREVAQKKLSVLQLAREYPMYNWHLNSLQVQNYIKSKK